MTRGGRLTLSGRTRPLARPFACPISVGHYQRSLAFISHVEPLAPAPLPRLHELPGPDAAQRRLGIGFLVNLVERIAAVGQRPSPGTHQEQEH